MDSSYAHLCVIRASGADAASFLHNQLTNDFILLPPHQWQLAAYCSPKGRMLASLWGIKLTVESENQDILLVLSKDIAEQTLRRLSMFILRAKVSLSDASRLLPELLVQHKLKEWADNEVERGIARITAPLVDLFLPQMLNYESINGVSFKKGCYPGQEVVARSQFRGALKRRTYLVSFLASDTPDGTPKVGEEVFSPAADEAVGVVLQTTLDKALICIQNHAAGENLRLASGCRLTMQALPYTIRDDI